jgi:hypothetical protein
MVKAGKRGNERYARKEGNGLRPPVLLFLCFPVYVLVGCARATPVPAPTSPPTPSRDAVNLDAETQQLIAGAERVAFIIPFSHWDTDWHDTFDVYSRRSNTNLINAITMAKAEPRFRYAMEQVLFVRHFWEAHPEYREDLETLVRARQLTFAWAGVTQPETSLAAPAIQVRNWQTGRDWIAATFGAEYVPQVAWQSDAFGNSAALPLFLQQMGVPYLFLGRWQYRCDPAVEACVELPLHFFWKSPAAEARALVAYVFYSDAWGDIFRAGADEARQLDALQAYVDGQFERTTSRYALIPIGFDFLDPLPQLMRLAERNNAASRTAFVVSDPETAFGYIATQDLPEFDVDLNPLWQGFYGSRPFARIADKESEYFLTANDKFGMLVDAPISSAWYTATVSAHYDNIGAVSFDRVWEATQKPRFQQTLEVAAHDLTVTLAQIASSVPAPLLVFNPTSWARREVIEIGEAEAVSSLAGPRQPLRAGGAAVLVDAIPALGYAVPRAETSADPVSVQSAADGVTLRNGLVTVTLDPAHGGAFSSLQSSGGPELVDGLGDEVAYWTDTGDIYGARFGEVLYRAGDIPAQMMVLEEGPLLARVQAAFSLGGQPITKTVTLRADSPLVEIMLEIKALPETSALVHTPTRLQIEARTDDLGFGAFTHEFDVRPIAPGDITYRRKIFYPTMYWTDVSDADAGLTLITHGLQGVGGVNNLSLLLTRQVTDKDGEGLTDPETHALRYAYLPHTGSRPEAWRYAYEFNQPLIPAWRGATGVSIQLPFRDDVYRLDIQPAAASHPPLLSLLAAESGLIADVMQEGEQLKALILDYDPATPVTVTDGASQFTVSGLTPQWVPVNP